MSTDPDDILARSRAARARARALEGRLDEARTHARRLEERHHEAQVENMMTRVEHLLVRETPEIDARLRHLLEDGAALHRP